MSRLYGILFTNDYLDLFLWTYCTLPQLSLCPIPMAVSIKVVVNIILNSNYNLITYQLNIQNSNYKFKLHSPSKHATSF